MLHALLDANLRFRPDYQGHLSNHLPMALHALHSLGASPERLQQFYAGYATRLQTHIAPGDGEDPRTAIDWLPLRGQQDAYAALMAYFHGRVAAVGTSHVLAETVPALLPGVSAALFHGVIRTAHVYEAGHSGELAAALAYWACRWEVLPEPADTDTATGFEAWASQLVTQSSTWRAAGRTIPSQMLEATASPLYQRWAGALAPAPTLRVRVAQLSALAAERYAASPNFTVLHLVTGLRAFRVLLPWMDDSPTTQAVLAQNFFAAYMAAQVQPDNASEVAPRSWPQLIAAAMESDDEHAIKLVHACRDEAKAYGEGHYLLAANRLRLA